MADLEWLFNVSGNAKEALDQVDQVLAAMGKDLPKTEAGLKQLERALAAQNIAKISDPLRQNIALAKLHAQSLREDSVAANAAAEAAKKHELALRKEGDATAKAAAMAKDKGSKEAAKDADALGASIASAFGVGQIAKISGVAGAIDLVAGAVKSAASLIANGSIELFKFALDASQGKRAMIGMLEVFEGSRTDKVFGVLQDMGIAVGASADKSVQAYANLRAAGFAAKESQDVLAASFDIAAARGGGEQGLAAADKFQDLFVKFRALGKVGSKDLLALARDVGIDPTKQLPEALAARMKVPVDQAVGLLAAGKADAVTVQNALLDIVQKDLNKGGALGDRAKALADGSIPAQLQRVKDIASNLFEDASFAPVAAVVKNIADALKIAGERGDLKQLSERFIGLLGGLENFDAGTAIESVVEVISSIVTGLESLKSGFSAAFHPEIFTQATEQLDKIDTLLGGASEKGDTMRSIGTVFGFIATSIALAVAVLAKFIELAARVESSVVGTLSAVKNVGSNVGTGFADGIAQGDAGKVFDAGLALAKAPIKAITGELEIRSPSRKMFALGRHTGEGFSGGLESESPGAALAASVQTPTISTSTSTTNASTRGGITITFGNIIVQGGGSGDDTRSTVRAAVFEALEEAGLA